MSVLRGSCGVCVPVRAGPCRSVLPRAGGSLASGTSCLFSAPSVLGRFWPLGQIQVSGESFWSFHTI
eukprot:1926691-Prymnesium_polylepis.1